MQSGKCLVLMKDGIRENTEGLGIAHFLGSSVAFGVKTAWPGCVALILRVDSRKSSESPISSSLLPYPFPLLCGVDDSYAMPPLNLVGLVLHI